MPYGVLPPRKMPVQDPELIMILADRYARAAVAHEKWATPAKKAIDVVEGRQWDAATLKEMARKKRPALTLNMVNRLVRLVLGYYANNTTTIKFLPGHDGTGSTDTADILNMVSKQVDEINDMVFRLAECDLDGLITGRGFMDSRLDFDDNDFGEVMERAKNPFTMLLDPDGESYDLNETSSFVVEKRIVSADEVEAFYGPEAGEALKSFMHMSGDGGIGGMLDLYARSTDIAPPTGFGQFEDADRWFQMFEGFFADGLVDPYRKTTTVLDFQYWTRRPARLFVDLETGDRKVIPDTMDDQKIAKILYYAELKNNPVTVVTRRVKKLRWTTLAGPYMIYDNDRIPYDRFTVTPYFPYFRRGATRGMVEDLIDPQLEKNKRHSAKVEILSKTANGGWVVHTEGVSPEQLASIKSDGSTPGFVLEWKGEQHQEPKQLTPQINTQRQDRLEDQADDAFGDISGITPSALGSEDVKVQSGRALEAKQRQAVISIQMYLTNRSRTVQLIGQNRLSMIQNHYTEERVMRIMGEDGEPKLFTINQAPERSEILNARFATARLNDVTIGKYVVAIDDTPISSTFLNAQFQEALLLLREMGPVGQMLMQTRPDLVIQMSSLPRKDEWIEAIRQAIGLLPPQGGEPGDEPGDESGGAPAAPAGPPGGNAPSLDQGTGGRGAEIIRLTPGG